MSNEKPPHKYATLFRALQVQQLYQEKKAAGYTDVHIHATFIFPAFGICIRTMQRYLEIPAKRWIKTETVSDES